MPAPNRQGAVTNAVCSSHGNDIDSDGACVTGPQPYIEGENESFAGMLPVPSECGLEPKYRVRHGSHPVAGCHGLRPWRRSHTACTDKCACRIESIRLFSVIRSKTDRLGRIDRPEYMFPSMIWEGY